MEDIELKRIINNLPAEVYQSTTVDADVLRLDLIHPLISGNKWFKLNKYLAEAEKDNKQEILTFGGAFSNHILATATTCKLRGFKAIGIIRGEESPKPSHTLIEAGRLGMKLFYTSREAYKQKKIPEEILRQYPSAFFIPEGGYGIKGMEGAKEILNHDTLKYSHILVAVGTGTTLAGLAEAASGNQKIIGISVLKNNFSLNDEIEALLSADKKNKFEVLHQFHFGGYAKKDKEIIRFMNSWYLQTGIPSDFVYTAKLFYGFRNLVKESFFPPNSKILLIHTGGLQGNNSLPNGTLIF